ncbi:MAG TPA: ATP-binding protein, partial [Methanothrix sp.]|nr:ATP-binding protein [Methanothrix sp.]
MKKIQIQTALFALVLLAVWWQAGLWYQERLMDEERTQVAGELQPQGNSLAMAISERLELLEGLAAFVQAEIESSRSALDEEFLVFSSQIYARSIGIRNLAVAPQGVFRYVYPPESRPGMMGQSLFLNISPAFKGDVQRAVSSRKVVLSPPHNMRRGGLGVVARKSVFEDETFWGFVSMTIDIPIVLQAAGLNFSSGSHRLKMALRDDSGKSFFGDASVFGSDPVISRVQLADGYWELAGVPATGWAESVQVPLRIAQMGGLVIIGLVIILFFLTVSRQDTLNLAVMERTEDLNRELAERQRAEKALLERELYLKAIFEAATTVAFIIADARNRQPLVIDFSPGAEKAFGWLRDEVINKPVSMFILPQDRERLYRAAARMKDDKQSHSGFIYLLRRSGEIFPAMYSIHPLLDESGSIYGALGVCIDMTEQKKMEEELVRAKEAAEASSRAKAAFTAGVSHEMRTPLNAIIGMTELLLERDLDPVARDYAETVRSSGQSLLAIINEILDFSKMDGRNVALSEEPIDLQEMLEASLDQVSAWSSEKHLELAYFIEDGTAQRVMGDAQKLHQVLVNLLSNAIKFTESGEVTVSVSRDRIFRDSVSKDREAGLSKELGEDDSKANSGGEPIGLVFHVADTGIGIPEDRTSSLFIPFSQVDTSLSRKYSGTGLGLAISSRLVELMGGRIWAESTVGVGSRFHFAVPLKPAFGGRAGKGRSEANSLLAGKRALIAFSRASAREMLAGHVAALGMTAGKAVS